MPLLESESIILKTYALAEADRIVVFFTRQYGLVRGVAKGAKRLNSKFGSTLEPFSVANIEFFQKEEHELVSIQNAELLRSVFEQAGDPEFLDTFSYISDLLAAFSPPHDADETLYRMVSACIDSAAAGGTSFLAYRVYFELWLLRLGGYLPEWKHCGECRRPMAGEPAYITGGMLLSCANCAKAGPASLVDDGTREIFAAIQRLSPTDLAAWAAGREAGLNDLSILLRRVISRVIGREPVLGTAAFSGNDAK
jgi:DNA repair protein RecO (recombination protein O)